MTRFIRIIGLLASIDLVLAILAQVNSTNANSDQSPLRHSHTPLGPIHNPTSPIPLSYSTGIPAIRPHSASSSLNTPSFTIDDVKAYILTASEPKLVPVQGTRLTIEKVLFISSKEATQLMQGESAGRPDDALVCFVLLKGPFYVQVDYAPGALTSTASIATEIAEVFDAHTGNLLVWAILC